MRIERAIFLSHVAALAMLVGCAGQGDAASGDHDSATSANLGASVQLNEKCDVLHWCDSKAGLTCTSGVCRPVPCTFNADCELEHHLVCISGGCTPAPDCGAVDPILHVDYPFGDLCLAKNPPFADETCFIDPAASAGATCTCGSEREPPVTYGCYAR